jgi:hypothetical protein
LPGDGAKIFFHLPKICQHSSSNVVSLKKAFLDLGLRVLLHLPRRPDCINLGLKLGFLLFQLFQSGFYVISTVGDDFLEQIKDSQEAGFCADKVAFL